MKTFLITFKLNNPETDLELISVYLRTSPKWARLLDTVWIIKSSEEIATIRDNASNAINNTGIIAVLEITKSAWGTYAVSKELTDWMKANI